MPDPHPADRHDVLRVVGAREHNLKGVSVAIPKRRLTVFTGVSGSGKSSLAFSTIAAEAQRLVDATYSTFVQGFMPPIARPDVDAIEGLTTAIVVDQARLGGNARSTVGTVTDANALLRVLWSRLGEPHVGPPNAFSFNVPSARGSGSIAIDRGEGETEERVFTRAGGMCPRCEGMGQVSDLDPAALFDGSRSLRQGALTIPGYGQGTWLARLYAESGLLDPDKPIRAFSAEERRTLLHGGPTKVKVGGASLTFEGLVPRLRRSLLAKDVEAMTPHVRAFVDRAVAFTRCPDCAGTRLSAAARSSKIRGLSIADACALEARDLAAWARAIDAPAVAPLLASIGRLLDGFVEIGLGYLALDRATGTLSGGEAQRTKMVRHLGSALTDVTYVFDEPTVGMHAHDVARMGDLLLRLRDRGNTVLAVEHDPRVVALADHVVDLGPGAGAAGGRVVFEGTFDGLRASGTTTGRHLGDRAALKAVVRRPSGTMEVRGARTNNLRSIDVDLPLGVLVAITGVAGSGKSSLVRGSVCGREGVVTVDQAPIRGSRRSSPATYADLAEPVRKAFAKRHRVKAALFSANSEGACPACGGAGVIETDLGPLASVTTPCEDCEGRRFQPAVLAYRLGGKDIAEVLDLSVDEALAFFSEGEAAAPAARAILARLADVGLGYLRIGQPLGTLSGGERQRLKLAAHLGDEGAVIVLDEPTAGLHVADVGRLLALLDRLVDAGRSVIVIEHDLSVVARADWVVDLGPGAGHEGGRVVFEGTPAALAAARSTLTGQHLAAWVAGG